MATFTKYPLSTCTNGVPKAVTTTSTTLHTAVSGTTSWDEIWIYANNEASTDTTLTVNYGGGSSTCTLKAKAGLALIIPGEILNNGKTVAVSAGANNAIKVSGFVNRITN